MWITVYFHLNNNYFTFRIFYQKFSSNWILNDIIYIVCRLLVCLHAWKWIDTYHRSRSGFWQDSEESVINRHVIKVEWCQLGHEGDGLSTQPGCLRVESKMSQSHLLDLWKNVCWTINSRDAWRLWNKTLTLSCKHNITWWDGIPN